VSSFLQIKILYQINCHLTSRKGREVMGHFENGGNKKSSPEAAVGETNGEFNMANF
jgi:hypothetical protein